MAILKDLIVHGSSRFLNKIYASEIQTPLIEAEAGIFKKLKANDATVVGLLDVKGQLHTNSWSNSNIATIDGSFYITPTIGSTSGTVTITASSLVFSGTNYAVSSLYLGDGSSITWPQYSKVLVTGQILSNGEWIPLGTLLGQLDSAATATSISIKSIKDNKKQDSNILATLVSNGTTSSDYRNLKVSLYQRAASSTDFRPLGIYMTATGINGRTFLDIYGGVEPLNNNMNQNSNYGGFAEPNVRIGNLQGLPNVGGQTPSGWGIYTDNGYFKGIIAADQGYIGSGSRYWVIANYEDSSNPNNSRSYIYSYNGTDNGTDSVTSTVEGIYLGTDGIRNYKDSTHYVTIKNGVISALGADLSGKIIASSGSIGGWNIGTDTNKSLYYGNQTPGATTTNLVLSPTSTTNSNAIGGSATGLNWFLSAGKVFGVTTSGALYATSGKIGSWEIGSNYLLTGTWGTGESALLSTGSSLSKKIGGSDLINNWVFTAGANFGVTKSGALYASSANISGKITATSGEIGGITIDNNGKLWITDANISGTISGDHIDASSISIGSLKGGKSLSSNNLLKDVYASSLTKENAPWNRYLSEASNTTITGQFIAETNLPDPNATHFYRITDSSASTKGRGLCFYSSGTPPFIDGHTYRIGCWVRKHAGSPKVFITLGSIGSLTQTQQIVDNTEWEWIEIVRTFGDTDPDVTTRTDTYKRLYFYFYNNNVAGSSLDMCGFRMEEIQMNAGTARNLLLNTEKLTNWGVTNGATISDGIVTFPTVTANSWREIYPAKNFKYDLIKNQYAIFSIKVKGNIGEKCCINLGIGVDTTETAYIRKKFLNQYVYFTGTGEWQTVCSAIPIFDYMFTFGSGTVDFNDCWVTVRIGAVNNYWNGFQAKEPQLCLGTTATSWSRAPEDIDESIDNIEIGGRNLVRNSADFDKWVVKNGGANGDIWSRSVSGNTSNVNLRPRTWIGTGYLADYYNKTLVVSFEIMSPNWSAIEEGSSNTGLNGLAIQLETASGIPYSSSIGATGRYFFKRLGDKNYFKTDSDLVDGKWVKITSVPLKIDDTLWNNSTTLIDGYDYFTFSFILRRNGEISFRKPQIELGNKATDFTLAPEDIEVDIEEAKKVATNYITQIDNTGIKITPYDKSGNDYLQLNSDAISMYRNNIETLRIEDSAIRIGKTKEAHFLLTSSRLTGYGNNNNIYFDVGKGDNANVRMFYGVYGDETSFEIGPVVKNIEYVKKEGVLLTEGTDYEIHATSTFYDILFDTNPSLNSTITINYRSLYHSDTYSVGSSSTTNVEINTGYYVSTNYLSTKVVIKPKKSYQAANIKIKKSGKDYWQDTTNYTVDQEVVGVHLNAVPAQGTKIYMERFIDNTYKTYLLGTSNGQSGVGGDTFYFSSATVASFNEIALDPGEHVFKLNNSGDPVYLDYTSYKDYYMYTFGYDEVKSGDQVKLQYLVSQNTSLTPDTTIVENYTWDSSLQEKGYLSIAQTNQILSVAVDNNILTLNEDYTLEGPLKYSYLILSQPLAIGEKVEIRFTTRDYNSQYDSIYLNFSNKNIEDGVKGINAASFGSGNVNKGAFSLVEGVDNIAAGYAVHVEGYDNIATGSHAHAEGEGTKALSLNSHASGQETIVTGINSYAGGYNTIAASSNQYVIGRFNIKDTNNQYAFIVGNGISEEERSNAFAITWNGGVEINNLNVRQLTVNARKPFLTVRKTYTRTITANSACYIGQSYTSPTGYIPIGIIDWGVYKGSHADYCIIGHTYIWRGTPNSIDLYVWNQHPSESAVNVEIDIDILCIANTFL